LQSAKDKGFHFELLEKPIHPAEIVRIVGVTLSNFARNHPDTQRHQ
jgi:hypothetical protein